MATPTRLGNARVAMSLCVLVASGVLASIGCVTIDDRATVEAGASGQGQGGSTGGSSAKGGTGGSSAQGGSGGSSAKGGSGGSSATGGTGGGAQGGTSGSSAAGKGGSAGTPSNVKCGDQVAPSAARVRACVYSMSCNPLQPAVTMSDCVTYGYFTSCETTAMSCEDIEHCTGVKREPESACGPDDPNWRCDGNVATRCGSNTPYSIDCGRVADTCDVFESEQDPARWPCKLNSPSSCSTGDAETRTCTGASYYSCIDSEPYGFDCGTFGYVCLESTPGLAQCTDRVVACDDDQAGVVTCAGNSVQVCDTSHRFATYDCTPAGSTCYVDGTSNGYCLAPGCTPESACEESCLDATHMQLCVGNAPYEVDCTDYGFASCVSYANHPVSGDSYVECQLAPAAEDG